MPRPTAIRDASNGPARALAEARHPAGSRAMAADVLAALRREPKELPCKYFYDEQGSELFEEITRLPEYYPTRVETSILEAHAPEMAERLGRKCLLVELGSGSSRKTRILLDALREPAGYVPIDISREHLLASAATLRARYPGLEVLPVHADYTGAVEIPRVPGEARRGVFFPGSTIGNFHHDETVAFLRRIADLVGPGGGLLVGADLKKDPAILHRAYNDSAGVTARFNRNILARLNRELGCDFDVDRFRHRAFWDEAAGRIEMHLDSLADQVVHVGAEAIALRRGESIWTESSYKYSVEEFGELAARGGLRVERVWTDGGRLFSVQFLAVRSRSDEFR